MESKLTAEEFQALRQKRAAEDSRYTTIASTLKKLFWDDSCNDINYRLYQRLEEEAIIHGEPVRKCLKQVSVAALSARDPVRYFAASITRRLREQGYLNDGSEDLGL